MKQSKTLVVKKAYQLYETIYIINETVKKDFKNLTDKSLERLTSSGLGTRTSQMMNPPTAMILPGTMKE